MGNVVRWSEEQLADHMRRNPAPPDSQPAKADPVPLAGVLPVAVGELRDPGMNKLEAAYAQHLDALRHAGTVIWWRYEAVGLRLADRTFYHPDFMVMMADGALEIVEIKGRKGDSYYCMDDAKVKVKVAAAQFPMRFFIVWPNKSGGWNREGV